MNNLSFTKRFLILIIYVGIIALAQPLSKLIISLIPHQNYNLLLKSPILMMLCIDIIIMILYFVFLKKDIKEEWHKTKGQWLRIIKIIVLSQAFYLVVSFVLDLILNSQVQAETSANQTAIIFLFKLAPISTVLATLIGAPFIEEFVFRYALIGTQTKKAKIITLVISSILFGLSHVVGSIQIKNFDDLIFLPQYVLMGLVIGYTYLKSGTIFGSMLHHFLNNLIAIIIIALS